MTAELDDWGLLSIADVIGEETKPQAASEKAQIFPLNELLVPFRSLGGSDVTEQCIMMLISCLKNDSERRMSSMEDVFRNRSQKIKRSLETCERIRELYVEAMESFSSSASHYEKRNSAFESVSLLGAAIIGKENAAYSSALLDSIARVDWAQASSVSCVEVLHALYTHIDENKMSSQMRTTLCTTKLWLALQSGRLSSLTKALVHPDATSQLPEPIKGPLPKPASLLPDFELIQTSMDSFMTCSCSFPYSVETKGVDCCMDGGNLMVCCGGTMTQFESMGMMGSRLHRRDEFRIDVERGERVLSSQMGVITTIRCISRHDSGRAYRLCEWSSNHEVQRSTTVDIRISRLHAVSSAFHFSMWEDSLSCLVTSENSNKVRSRMYVAAVTVDDVFKDNRFEWEMDPESSMLWRDAAKMSSSKALHFTKTTAVSLGRVTMKDHFHPFCIELWAYPRNLSEKQTVFSIGDKGTDEILIEIEPSGDGLLWRGGSRTPQLGASFTSYNCPGKLSSAERWWHVALNFTGTTWELWLDGQVASRHESLVSPEPIRDAKCHLGKSFAGLLAEVRVWNQVRNGTELRRDSRRALRGSEPDLIAYFPLDENNGNLIVDYSKNAEHVLMGHGSLKWSTLEVFPTTRPDVPRLTADFVPLAELEDRENMFFCVSPYYFRIAVLSLNSPHGPAITIFQYRRSDHSLYSQIRIECSNTWRLKGLAVNSSKDSILCWAVSTEKPSEMMLWDVHSYAVCSMVPMQNVYSSVWSCGRDVLQNASTLSQRFLSADKYLTDQSSWTAAIPPHLVDFDEELIPLLLELAHKAAGEVDEELSSCVCVLLRANLFFRFTMDEEKMRRDFDAPYPSHTALLSVLGPDSGKEERGSCRDAIVKLAFLPFASRSNLLQMCCQCFMTESCRIAFLKATAGKARSANEDVLFACVVEYYSMLQTCNSIIKSPDQAHVLYNALILEATYQVERSIRENNFSSLKRTSRCLEVFQEMLFAHLLKDSENSELSTLGLNYCKTLLRASEKTVYAMVKAYRKHPHVEYPFGTSLEISIVGALLPSLAVSLPLLPTVVLSACSVTLQSCRESLSSLDDAMPNKAQWVSDLGVAVTFSLCLIGCSMLHAVPEVAVNENVEIKYLNLMRNGIRKTGTERDVLIKNLQQGVGAISKIFEELQKADRTALCVVRDEQLKMIERQVMAAFCALTVPTKELKEASKASLEPVYRHVLKMRPWVLSKRQESRNLLQPIENKARFLAQFDVCYHTGTDLIAPSNLRHRTKEENTQSKWKKLFKQWKAMRALKALLTTQSDHSSPLIYSEITDFIEGSVDCTELERLVAWRSQKATYRLGGLLLLKQLTGEARVSPALSSILLPVMTKMLSGWHYAEGVECCSSESLLHVHGAFFQLFDTTLSKYLEERPENREPWAVLLISLFTSKWRSMDFVKVRSDVPRAFRMMWGAVDKDNNPRTAFKKRVNGILPPAGRETKLVARGAAPSLIVGDSGLTIKSVGGRGTCVAPYVWRENNKLRFTYYYEVYLVELVPGSSFSLGVGPVDYSLSRMPGWDANSFALQSDEGILFTGSASGRITGCSFRSGDVIGCGWNQSKKEIFWTKNGVFLTSCEGFPEELSPILGFDGKGIAQVNFGTDLFLYTQLERKETQLKDIPNARIANDAWDAFRIFSLQATSSLARSASNSHAQDSRKETISCVGMCFTALGDELTDLCIPGRPMSENSAKAYRLKIVLAHCSTLVQLLSKTPREFTPPDVTHLVATIERVSLALLQTPSTSTDVLIALLMTWFHVVDLIPLSDASEATAETSAAGAGSPVSAFLQTLISLALRLPFHSRDANSETCLQDLLISARLWQNPSEEVLWVALALLQRMNRDGTGLVPHAGESVLHQWIVRILHTSVKATREVQLALFILGGGPRFAVVGDKVLVRRAQHSQSSYTLMRYSLSEEICDVIDDEGKFRTLPLRIVDLVIGDDEGQCYFPVVGHATHAVQAEEVLQCAMRMLEAVAIRHSVEAVSVQGQLLSILWRCTVRGVTQFPQRLVPSLARLSEAMELSTRLDIRNVRADIVFTENCCTVFQHHRAQSVLGSLSDTNLNNSTNITCSNTHVTEGRGEMSPASELSGLDDGRSRERDLSDSENDESRYLTALNDELADDEELELEEEEDEEESDLSNRDYPDDLGPSTGSDGMEEEEAQETGFAPNSDMVEESFEAIHFNRGCLRVISNRTVGQTYTIDFHVRLGDIFGHQILFVQQVNTRSHMSTEIIARVRNGGIDYGWIESVPGEERGASTGEMCRCSLSAEDRGTWVRLTFVQSELALWLFKNGTLQESKETRHAGGSLLEEEFFLGGVPEDSRSSFVGDLKDIRIYDTAMRPAMVDQLHSLNSSLAAFVDAHLCVVLRARRDGFDNFSKSSAAILLDIMREGEVEYVESSNLHSKKKELDTCTPELDFGCDAEDAEVFSFDTTSGLIGTSSHQVALWRKKQELTPEQLLLSHGKSWKQLSSYYSTSILASVLNVMPSDSRDKPHEPAATSADVVAADSTRRIVQLAVASSDSHLYDVLEGTLIRTASQHPQHQGAPSVSFGNEALKYLTQIAQREQRTRVFESAHPLRSTVRSSTEVHVPGQAYYHLLFDVRTLASNMVLTFAADAALTNTIRQAPAYALSSFSINLPRFFFDVRSDASSPQWGYKISVVYDCQSQLRSMRLLRSTLSASLRSIAGVELFDYFRCGECLRQLGHVARINGGKTRRLALSCISDLLLHSVRLSLPLPFFPQIHEIRRMAERQHRRRMGQTLHSRFVQVSAECYGMYRDALHCGAHEAITGDPATEEQQQNEAFTQHRLEQRVLYRQRDSADRITIQKVTDPHNLHVEWNTERICVARSEASGGSMIAGVALSTGRWYYEMRLGGSGFISVGVMPNRAANEIHSRPNTDMSFRGIQPIAFNGHTGMSSGRHGADRRETDGGQWSTKDYVGVLLDIPNRRCHFFVNGIELDYVLDFGGEEAASAAAQDLSEDTELSFYPYFFLDHSDTVTINFGGSYFEYEPPRGCLPLDPTNLSLGTLLPYNQMRAFHDLSAHVLTGGSHPIPPFFYEEADPFAESTERSGPAHVSLHAVDGIQLNLLEVKNAGTSFGTVTADCSVSGGCWYYEITLRTQGLMQVGWMLKSGQGDGSVGDTSTSWSIDLFRRLKWHNGRPEAVTVPRRWAVGDVIGCAIDLQHRELTFTFNGRQISGGALTNWTFHDIPVAGAEYVPAISLRSGNGVSFNFGSSAFKYKPEGFNALGVSDSWCERMDTFYSNEQLSSTCRRLTVLRQLWSELGEVTAAQPDTIHSALEPYLQLVSAVDNFAKETGKGYAQMTASVLKERLTSSGGSDPALLERTPQLLEVLLAVARVAQVSIPFFPANTVHPNILTKLFLVMRTVLFRSLRVNLVEVMLKETNVRPEHFRLYINRVRARAQRTSLKASIFGQTFSLMADQHPRMFQTNKRYWNTVLMGEGAEDVGGPFREHMNEMCQELMSTNLPFFVPTANNLHNTGGYRDAVLPAAACDSPHSLACYVFIGKMMGGAMRSEEPLGFNFPPLVWRYLSCYPITESHLDEVDRICLQCVREFRGLRKQGGSQEAFNDIFDGECFVTRLSDGSVKELIPNGSTIKVTFERSGEYAEALLASRLHECDLQLKMMREGMLQVVPEMTLLLLTPEELEARVCGRKEYKVDELRKSAIYEGLTVEERRVQFLWQALEDATPLQRRLFLRFVSGRDRLPIKLRVLPLITQGDPDASLPRAATCFFAIELPDYSSLEVMKRKLFYSIENCADLDTDFTARSVDETEGPHLMLGVEDARPEELANATAED